MKTTNLTAACMIVAMSTVFASASFAEFEDPEEPPIGCLSDDCEEPDPPTKGNNGWGNGIDGENPGSDEGPASQVTTKQNEAVWEKFEGKFDGR
jgi:hypothetical protein